MNRPVWLLDVDGVLNATRPGWSAAPKAGNAYTGADPAAALVLVEARQPV